VRCGGWIAIAQIGAATGGISLFTRERARHKAASGAASILGLETEVGRRGRGDRGCCAQVTPSHRISSLPEAALAFLLSFANVWPVDGAHTKLN